MDHKYSDADVRVALVPSRIGVVAVALMALATLSLLAFIPGAAAPRVLAATWVACAALHALRRRARALRFDPEGAIEVQDGAGTWRAGTVRDGSFVAPWLTIVRWRPRGARFDASIVLLPDMLPAEDFRRVRVWLRWS